MNFFESQTYQFIQDGKIRTNEDAIAVLSSITNFKGVWDATVGFPTQADPIIAGNIWLISVQGTLDGTLFQVGDYIVANVNTPPNTVAPTGWGLISGADNQTLIEVLAQGNSTGANDIIVTAGQKITVDSIKETTVGNGVEIADLDISGTTILSTTNLTVNSNTDLDLISGTQVIDANTANIQNVIDPINPQDAATKKYVDDTAALTDTLSEVLANGNTSGANDIIVNASQKVTTDTITETTANNGVVVDTFTLNDKLITTEDGYIQMDGEVWLSTNDDSAYVILNDLNGITFGGNDGGIVSTQFQTPGSNFILGVDGAGIYTINDGSGGFTDGFQLKGGAGAFVKLNGDVVELGSDAGEPVTIDGVNLDMGHNIIQNVATIQSSVGTELELISDTAVLVESNFSLAGGKIIKLGNNVIHEVATPTVATDAANKSYVDGLIDSNNELSEVLANGNTTGGTNISMSVGDSIQFGDDLAGIYTNNPLTDGFYMKGGAGSLISVDGDSITLSSQDDLVYVDGGFRIQNTLKTGNDVTLMDVKAHNGNVVYRASENTEDGFTFFDFLAGDGTTPIMSMDGEELFVSTAMLSVDMNQLSADPIWADSTYVINQGLTFGYKYSPQHPDYLPARIDSPLAAIDYFGQATQNQHGLNFHAERNVCFGLSVNDKAFIGMPDDTSTTNRFEVNWRGYSDLTKSFAGTVDEWNKTFAVSGTYTGTTDATFEVEIVTPGNSPTRGTYRWRKDGGAWQPTRDIITFPEHEADLLSDGVTIGFATRGTTDWTAGDSWTFTAYANTKPLQVDNNSTTAMNVKISEDKIETISNETLEIKTYGDSATSKIKLVDFEEEPLLELYTGDGFQNLKAYAPLDLGVNKAKTSSIPSQPEDVTNKNYVDNRTGAIVFQDTDWVADGSDWKYTIEDGTPGFVLIVQVYSQATTPTSPYVLEHGIQVELPTTDNVITLRMSNTNAKFSGRIVWAM